MFNKSFGQINVTKMHSFIFREAPTLHIFIFNALFFYELKHKVPLSKTVCAILSFQFRFLFIKVHIFLNKKHGLFDFKTS